MNPVIFTPGHNTILVPILLVTAVGGAYPLLLNSIKLLDAPFKYICPTPEPVAVVPTPSTCNLLLVILPVLGVITTSWLDDMVAVVPDPFAYTIWNVPAVVLSVDTKLLYLPVNEPVNEPVALNVVPSNVNLSVPANAPALLYCIWVFEPAGIILPEIIAAEEV